MDDMPLDDFSDDKGFWTRLKDRFGSGPDDDEDFDQDHKPSSKKPRGIPIRLTSARINRVSVWHAADNIDAARLVADGLKQGYPQVVNLENTSPEMAARIIDFLNGVIYALDGSVEKVGHKVFFFTPSQMVIEIGDASPRRTGLFTGN